MGNYDATKAILTEANFQKVDPEYLEIIERNIQKFLQDLKIPQRAVEKNPNTKKRIRRLLSKKFTEECEFAHLTAKIADADLTDPIISNMAADYFENQNSASAMMKYLDAMEADEVDDRFVFGILQKRMNFPETINSIDPTIFGPISEKLAETLKNLSLKIAWHPHNEQMTDLLYPHRADKSVTKEDFYRELLWGFVAFNFLIYLDRYRNAHRMGALKGNIRNDILNLCDQLDDQQILPTQETVDIQVNKDDSIIVVVGHSGLPINDSALIRELMEHTDLPSIQFAINFRFWDPDAKFKHPVKWFSPTMDISSAELMSTLRALRSKPHVAVVAPDGPFGNHRSWGKMIGHDVNIASGASSFAQLRNSKTVFLGTRWRDDMTREVYLIEGPTYDGTQSREAFDREFCAFYCRCMEDIAVGPARDIFGRAGVWTQLVKS